MDQDNIGKYIKDLRIKNNLTQADFASSLGVTYQAVSKWENGKNIPDVQILKLISEKYNVDIDEILKGRKSDKKKSYYKFIIIVLIGLIMIVGLIFFFNRDKEDYKFRQVTSMCSEFKISGVAAYDSAKSSLYITNIEYCEEDNQVYDEITCALYEEYENTRTKIASCSEGENTSIKDYIKTVEIKVDDYKQVCRKFDAVNMYIEVYASNGNTMDYIHKIPLQLEDNC